MILIIFHDKSSLWDRKDGRAGTLLFYSSCHSLLSFFLLTVLPKICIELEISKKKRRSKLCLLEFSQQNCSPLPPDPKFRDLLKCIHRKNAQNKISYWFCRQMVWALVFYITQFFVFIYCRRRSGIVFWISAEKKA